MNKMIEFAKRNRTTTYFRDYAISKIRIAYRIMEYLAPDKYFPPKDLDGTTFLLLKNSKFEEAIERIINEELCIDLGCSAGTESLYKNAIEACKYLQPIYLKKENKKQELLKEIKKLEIELEELESEGI